MPFQLDERKYTGTWRWPNLGSLSFSSSLLFNWLLASVFLICLIPIVGFDDVWSADVGAQLAQSQQLADGGGWFFSHPFPEADPSGEWFTYQFAGRVGEDYVVLAKHPAFSWLVAGLLNVGGFGLVMAFSALSTSTAALGVAVIVRATINRRTSVIALWIVATMSPLAFDAYLGYAHSFAAALAIWSMVGVIAHIRSGRLVHYGIPLGCLLAAAGPFVRSEAVLAGAALGVATMLTGGRWWTVMQRRVAFVGGLLVFVSTCGGFVIDRLLSIQADSYIGEADDPFGWISGRFQGFKATWLWASSSGWRSQDLLLVAVPICWYLAGRTTWSSSQSRRYLTVGVGLLAIWWVVDTQHVVPGLLLAFPLLVLLTSLLTTDVFYKPEPMLGLMAFILFAGAVVMTQYSGGGTAEWGGRYFAAGLPFVLVGVSGGIYRLFDGPPPQLRLVAAPAVLASLVLISAGIGALRQSKQLVGELGSSVEQVVMAAQASNPTQDIVVVSTSNAIGRLLWVQTSENPWLLVPPDELEVAMGELDAAGVNRVVVIAERVQETDRTIGPYTDVDVIEPWATSPVEILAFYGK